MSSADRNTRQGTYLRSYRRGTRLQGRAKSTAPLRRRTRSNPAPTPGDSRGLVDTPSPLRLASCTAWLGPSIPASPAQRPPQRPPQTSRGCRTKASEHCSVCTRHGAAETLACTGNASTRGPGKTAYMLFRVFSLPVPFLLRGVADKLGLGEGMVCDEKWSQEPQKAEVEKNFAFQTTSGDCAERGWNHDLLAVWEQVPGKALVDSFPAAADDANPISGRHI
eukprot:109351-Rhodomonas_salina.2